MTQVKIENQSDLYSREFGDILSVDGKEYIVAGQKKGLGHRPLILFNGEFRTLLGGATSDGETGIIFESDIPEDGRVMTDDILGRFDVVQYDGHDGMTQFRLPESETRNCPECDDNGICENVAEDDTTVSEIFRCNDCDIVYAYHYGVPEGDTATLFTYPTYRRGYHRGQDQSIGATFISGVYDRYDSDNFPLVAESEVHKGVRTASEVAEFLNRKMTGDDRFGFVYVERDGTVVWVDDQYKERARIEYVPRD